MKKLQKIKKEGSVIKPNPHLQREYNTEPSKMSREDLKMAIRIIDNTVFASIRLKSGEVKRFKGSSIDDIFYQLEKLI